MELIILSGRSGVGKSVALSVLEDQGFYCIDNLPVNTISSVLKEIESMYSKVVISIDIRNINVVTGKQVVTEEIDKLRHLYNLSILFFDCDTSVIINRYADTRREHPLMRVNNFTLEQAIEFEDQNLHFLREMADTIIDTSKTNVHQLSHKIIEWLKLSQSSSESSKELKLIFNSFGFKKGSPPYSNFIFDVRHLANPYWDKKLAVQTGLDRDVEIFFETHQESQEEIRQIAQYLTGWLERSQGSTIKKFVTISIGCTGGQHRSVYVANQLARYFSKQGYRTQTTHISLDIIQTFI